MSDNIEHFFHKKDLIQTLDNIINKTLGEVDSKNVFRRTIENPKITGIAGDVIEQSVLGYSPNSKQEPDLIVDNQKVELKTLGIRNSKKEKGKYEAKEPMTITAVSPQKIVKESYKNSNFYHKISTMLLVYYLYNSNITVKACDYANFPIKGYEFFTFNKEDSEILEKDWLTVKNFIIYLQKNYTNYENEYPRISSELRNQLLYIDTAPKWPNPPRFRIKRTVVTNIIQNYFGRKLEHLPDNYKSYNDIDIKCHELTNKFSNYSIVELMKHFEIDYYEDIPINKAIGEQIIVKMFGGKAKKMKQIDLFNKIGLLPKTIVITEEGKRTEDMKLFPIDFEELSNPNISFEDSSFREFFTTYQLMCIVFEEHDSSDFGTNTFLGFKRFVFNNEFIDTTVKKVWDEMRDLILNDKLVDVVIRDKKTNAPIINKNGTIKSAPNFPKSANGNIFVRGSGIDSSLKTELVNGIKMYKQYIWLRGEYISNELSNIDFL